MSSPDHEAKAFSPPYNVPWATFLSTVERAANDLPNKIDRSYLASQAGSTQTYLISALKAFDLIDNESRPTGLMRLAAAPERRPEIVGELLTHYYAPVVQLGQTKATVGELEKCFAENYPGITGESRKKAIRFFLSAANYAKLDLSSLWKAPKASSGPRKPSTRRRTAAPPASQDPVVAPSFAGAGYSTRVRIAAGTVVLAVDVNPIQLHGPDREFVFGLIDRMTEYAARAGEGGSLAADSPASAASDSTDRPTDEPTPTET